MIGDELSLEVLRALADRTRHRLYQELRASSAPLTTQDLAARAGLHANTVRVHLDLLCEVGLVEVDATGDGGRGRPRHRFRVADGSPQIGEAPAAGAAIATTNLARSLLALTRSAGLGPDLVRSMGRRAASARLPCADGPADDAARAIDRVVEHERGSGFAPEAERLDGGRWRVWFPTCPYGELASDAPEIVCSLHEGALDGCCSASGRLRLETFAPGGGGTACQAVLVEDDAAVPEPWNDSYASSKHKEAQT